MIYQFSRYISGRLMAEGVTIERARSLQQATAEAARIAPLGPHGETPVLVLREVAVAGLVDALTERHRQTEIEGWSAEHDDTHTRGELARAAACYATHATVLGSELETIWPWDFAWWKPADYRRDLIKATALLIAEIERIDRSEATDETGGVS